MKKIPKNLISHINKFVRNSKLKDNADLKKINEYVYMGKGLGMYKGMVFMLWYDGKSIILSNISRVNEFTIAQFKRYYKM